MLKLLVVTIRKAVRHNDLVMKNSKICGTMLYCIVWIVLNNYAVLIWDGECLYHTRKVFNVIL